eukprot:Hpha_TRINITY_DN16316_c0_g1::TRINITY_DN16316_c0_g1_i21::g.58637::m.58637
MDLETGFCTNFHVTTAGLGKGQRGTVGFVPIDFQGKQLLLGIGHVNHHPVNGRSLVRNWRYSHFFYAFESVPPFAIHAKSPEFCFPYEQQHKYHQRKMGSCPLSYSHQMAFGLSWQGDELLVSFGEQDCAARLAKVPRRWIQSAMRPVESRVISPSVAMAMEPESDLCRKYSHQFWMDAMQSEATVTTRQLSRALEPEPRAPRPGARDAR